MQLPKTGETDPKTWQFLHVEYGSGWIRNFFLNPDPELFVSDPNLDKMGKSRKIIKI